MFNPLPTSIAPMILKLDRPEPPEEFYKWLELLQGAWDLNQAVYGDSAELFGPRPEDNEHWRRKHLEALDNFWMENGGKNG